MCWSPPYGIRDMLFGREIYMLSSFNLCAFFMKIKQIDKVLWADKINKSNIRKVLSVFQQSTKEKVVCFLKTGAETLEVETEDSAEATENNAFVLPDESTFALIVISIIEWSPFWKGITSYWFKCQQLKCY